MKGATLALIISLSVHAASLYAACKSEGCKQAIAWKNGYTAIILNDDIGRTDYLALLDVVKTNKGIVAIEADRVLLGWVPVPAAGKIRSTRGVSAVLYDPVPRVTDLVHREQAIAALSFFNRVRNGEFEDVIEAGLSVKGLPLTDCAVRKEAPTASAQSLRSVLSYSPSSDENSFSQPARVSLTNGDEPATFPKLPGVVKPQWGFQTPYRNTQMIGRITVQFFRLDSDGSIDNNLYTWSSSDISTSNDQIFNAFTFWVNQATAHGITLSFRIQPMDPFSQRTRSTYPTPTHYEPIWHSTADDYLWMNDALAPLGYGASPLTPDNVFTKNEQFNLDKAADPVYGPYDGSFTVYLVYNPLGAPDHFTDGYGAYVPYLGGPSATVAWNSLGWGPSNIGLCLSHETGHIFWACDEYYNSATNRGCFSCYYCTYNFGPRSQLATPWVTNANCDHSVDSSSCDIPRTSCMMKDQVAMLCPQTPGQIGW